MSISVETVEIGTQTRVTASLDGAQVSLLAYTPALQSEANAGRHAEQIARLLYATEIATIRNAMLAASAA